MISALIPALHLDSRLVFRKHSATKWNANEEVGKLGYPGKKFRVAILKNWNQYLLVMCIYLSMPTELNNALSIWTIFMMALFGCPFCIIKVNRRGYVYWLLISKFTLKPIYLEH